MSWTEERIATLTKMWESGNTASQIAEELGGISRNAVIGKAHRLGLKSRPSPVKAGESEAKSKPKTKPAAPRAAPKPAPAPAPVPPAESAAPEPAPRAPENREPEPETERQQIARSVGPGGFLRQNPGEQGPPSTPAPPRRLVPARPSEAVADKTSLLDLNDRICKWPIGHPGEPDFHFCGEKVNPGFPYCVEHCGHAYQAQLPRRDRRPPPPLPYGGPRVR
ncbi:GcrA family cell cycle regulator [Stakelama saccharophila]|uniref:GcrA family cell cycle regulator n=1 Tax=Stakelama saccharophila TaxID=3075605 RepID=A0ABZ0BD12_9SPHN|nr:GcrA family cell cycle regulator [Stakelama sp. W311]WNO54758.1 GcrA family cell cycle regulator [Stakelama sp. W311]